MAENLYLARYSLPGTILFQLTSGSTKTVKGELVDVSFKAVTAYTKETLDKGLSIRFLLMNKDYDVRISGTGKVTYCQPVVRQGQPIFRIGLEYVNVDSDQLRDTMLRLSKALDPKEPKA